MEQRKRIHARVAVGVALLISIAIPIIWHKLGQDANGATDYLAYIGALVGAAATIVAVVSEIRADGEARKKEYELATQPIIWCGIDHDFKIRSVSPTSFLKDYENEIEAQKENAQKDRKEDIASNRYFVILSKDNDTYQRSSLNGIDESPSLEVHNTTYLRKEGGGIAECGSRYLVIPLIMKNVGVGPALSLCEGTRFLNETEAQSCKPPRILGVGECLRFVLCVDNSCRWDFNDRFDITASYMTVTGLYVRYLLEVTLDIDPKKQSAGYTIDKQGRTELVK